MSAEHRQTSTTQEQGEGESYRPNSGKQWVTQPPPQTHLMQSRTRDCEHFLLICDNYDQERLVLLDELEDLLEFEINTNSLLHGNPKLDETENCDMFFRVQSTWQSYILRMKRSGWQEWGTCMYGEHNKTLTWTWTDFPEGKNVLQKKEMHLV